MYYRNMLELKNFFLVMRPQFQLKTFFGFYFHFVLLLHLQTAPGSFCNWLNVLLTLLHDIEKLVNKTIKRPCDSNLFPILSECS